MPKCSLYFESFVFYISYISVLHNLKIYKRSSFVSRFCCFLSTCHRFVALKIGSNLFLLENNKLVILLSLVLYASFYTLLLSFSADSNRVLDVCCCHLILFFVLSGIILIMGNLLSLLKRHFLSTLGDLSWTHFLSSSFFSKYS